MAFLENMKFFKGKASVDKTPFPRELQDFFHARKNEEYFPYEQAKETLVNLQDDARDIPEFARFLLEDTVFSSLYATYYEHFFYSLQENPHNLSEQIHQFFEMAEKREVAIAEQTEYHSLYVENFGQCDGCPHCSFHEDVSELIPFWENGDIEFFMNLFVGMKTISETFLQIFEELLSQNPGIIHKLDGDSIFNFRKFLFSFAEEKWRIDRNSTLNF